MTRSSALSRAAHRYLSVSQVIAAQATLGTAAQPSSSTSPAAPSTHRWPRVAGLSVTLPPLCTWGAASSVDEPAGPRHGSPQPHGTRYAAVWRPIESYLTHLQTFRDSTHSATSTSAPPPPLCLSLRLFPDLTVAQLPAVPHGRDASSRRRRTALAPHSYPLEAILGARDSLWGDGADPQHVFRDAIAGLREMGHWLLPQLPLVLQLPTRLLVSQQFLHDLATLLEREGWLNVAFELPSTQQLYAGGTHTNSANPAAVDGAWCRLPLLCTPWPTLCRHPVLGASLRRLSRHDVVPFHVLLSWAVTEARLFSALEKSLVVDVTAPMPGAARRQAQLQSPDSVGCGGEALQSAFAGAADDAATAPVAHRVYMSENPATSRSVGVGLSAGVADAVRRHQSPALHRGDAGSSGGVVDLAAMEGEIRRQRAAGASASSARPAPRQSPPRLDDTGGDFTLVLDAPPEHLRALLARSVTDTDGSLDSPSLTSRQRLLQKVGRFMQHTVQDSASSAHAGETDAAVPAASVGDSDRGCNEATLEREAAELEELLREANSAGDAGAASMTEAERWMAEAQQHLRAAASGSSSPSSAPHLPTCRERGASAAAAAARASDGVLGLPSAWDSCAGYWACLHALVRHVADAPVVWSTPTLHAAAVAAWSTAFHAHTPAAHLPSADVVASHLPAIVPVWHPVQSAMCLEVERRSREGQCFAQPPPPEAVNEGPTLHTWLPAPLNTALTEALAALPPTYQARERQRLLHDLRRLRRDGAQAARRRVSVVEGTSGSVEDTGAEVRIRVSHASLPLQLLNPPLVRQRESEALQAAATAGLHAASGAEAADIRQQVRVVDDSVAEAIEQGYQALHGAAPASETEPTAGTSQLAPMALLNVPSPGLSPEALRRSWRCIS